MPEQADMQGIERIVFEPVREGQWRMRMEGGDVEGHRWRARRLAIEPAEEGEGGEPLYSIGFEDEDIEGHSWRRHR
jgi:hypothetical protein